MCATPQQRTIRTSHETPRTRCASRRRPEHARPPARCRCSTTSCSPSRYLRPVIRRHITLIPLHLQVQHYELLTLGSVAIFEEATLPSGVRDAFKAVCPSLALPPAAAGGAAPTSGGGGGVDLTVR